MDLLVFSCESDSHDSLRLVAEELFDLNAIRSENSAVLSMQKYSVLFSACFLAPFIMGALFSVSSSFGSITSGASMDAIVSSAESGIRFYLFFFCLAASIYAAFLDGNIKKSALYFALSASCAFAILAVS